MEIGGGTTFRWVHMQKLRCVWSPSRGLEGIKDGGRKQQECNLGPSALFIGVNNYLSAELSQLSARGNAKRNGRLLLP